MSKDVVFWVGVRSKSDLLQDKHGGFKYMDISKATWEYWCEKNDVTFYEYDECTNEDSQTHRPNWQRWFDLFDCLERDGIDYNRIALVDASSMVRWDCPNFFNEFDGRPIAFRALENLNWIYHSVNGYQDMFPDVKFDISNYFSSGFQIFDESFKPFLTKLTKFYWNNVDDVLKHQHQTVKKGTDQPVFNWLIQQEGIEMNLDVSTEFMLTHLQRFDWFSHNWQTGDKTPFFISHGFIWFFSGMSNKGQRGDLMSQTWKMIEGNYK